MAERPQHLFPAEPAPPGHQLELPGLTPAPRRGLETGGAQATISFLLRLRARGIGDRAVLRALETVPRDLFVPHRYLDLALRDVALPIPCGQTMPEPYLVARATEALELAATHRVLEVGTGSGYGTAILAQMAGEVLSLERFQSLAFEAKARLEGLAIRNAHVVWGDGLAVPAEIGLFDRIILHGVVDTIPSCILAALAEGGRIVFARKAPSRSVVADADSGQTARADVELACVSHRPAKGLSTPFEDSVIGPCRLPRLLPGLSRAL